MLWTASDGGVGSNTRLGYFFTSDAVVFVAAQGWGGGGTFRLHASELIDDVPADDTTEARLAIGGSIDGKLDFEGDSDWHRVEVRAGKSYLFGLEGYNTDVGTLIDGELVLYDLDGNFLQVGFFGGDGRIAQLSHSFASDGVVFIAAQSSWDTGTYRVSVTELTDNDIPDDTTTDATLAIGGSVTGSIDFARDSDWYRVEVQAGKTYVFDLTGEGTGASLLDPDLELYDADGYSLRWDGDERLGYSFASDGIVYIAAQFWSGTGTYRLSARELVGDVAENTTTTATLAIGGSVTGRIDYERDSDWYRVEVQAGKTYSFDLQTQGMFVYPNLLIYDVDGYILRSSYIAEEFNSRVSYSFASDAVVFVAAEMLSQTGTYVLSAEELIGVPPGVIELSALNGSNGFVITGVAGIGSSHSVNSGFSVSDAGDVNGDGIDDLIVGAPHPYNHDVAGRSYVVFGRSGGFAATVDASALDGSNGFTINGVEVDDRTGYSVSGAGDVNGDGIDDLIIGAPGQFDAGTGTSYVVFGSMTGFAPIFELSSLDGNNGFAVNGLAVHDQESWSVSSAGDVNGDGVGDVIVGADAGTSYVVFGSRAGFAPSLDLASLDGSNGFAITGTLFGSVSSAGDINADGFADVIVGERSFDNSYVVFGSATGFGRGIDVNSLDGGNGFSILGAGSTVSNAGDVNGDGIDDLLVNALAYERHDNFYDSMTYVIFGSRNGFDRSFDIDGLDGRNGFGVDALIYVDYPPFPASSAGDVDGDGLDDIIFSDLSREQSTYVLFGSAAGFPANVELVKWDYHIYEAVFDDTIGLRINGAHEDDGSGHSVSCAGDVNHDGIDDLIIGAPGFGRSGEGASYVVFGRLDDPQTTADGDDNGVIEGGGNNDTLLGNGGNDRLIGLRGDDGLDGGDGNDRLEGWAGDDLLVAGNGNDRMRGGDDADRLYAGAGNDGVLGGLGSDLASGGGGDDRLFGQAGDDVIFGGAGVDVIHAGAGIDVVSGEAGRDSLTGGAGNDTFGFASAADSRPGGADRILDFLPGDIIDLSGIDAVPGEVDDAFTFIGNGNFTAPGQLRVYVSGDSTILQGNTQGNGHTELKIVLLGAPAITEADLVL